MLNALVIILGLYCVLESISASAAMHKGDRLCRLAKFLGAGISGLFAIRIGLLGIANFTTFVMIASIALGVWPRMVFRITGGQRETDHWKGRYR